MDLTPSGWRRAGIRGAFRERYLDVVASVYVYNEHRGYTSLDRVLEAVRAHCPDEPGFIAEIDKHRADERKHYLMFKRWFELRGRMPLAVGRGYGHIDHFVQRVFGCAIDELDTEQIITDRDCFEKLCRVIALTEERGLETVEILLGKGAIRSDPVMMRIFGIIHQDEPDHFRPYRRWLERQGRPGTQWRERAADWFIHLLLTLVKLPALALRANAPRLERWPDADEAAA